MHSDPASTNASNPLAEEHRAGPTVPCGALMAEQAWRAGVSAWGDANLSSRDRSLIVIAALVAQGGGDAFLRRYLRWALDNGATRAELDALMALLAVYVGYPRASVGMELLRDELGAG